MLVHSLYEKVANTISQANLSKLSRSQTDWFEEELSRLSAEKQGDIDEISYYVCYVEVEKELSRNGLIHHIIRNTDTLFVIQHILMSNYLFLNR